MVSKKLLKSYDFENIEAYYNMILDSKVNGQYSQVKRQMKKLSKKQLVEFHECILWCEKRYKRKFKVERLTLKDWTGEERALYPLRALCYDYSTTGGRTGLLFT